MSNLTKEYTIGRSKSASLYLPENSVSRHHATLRVGQDKKIYIIDNDSTAGTYIKTSDGFKKLKKVPVPVKATSTLKFGDAELSMQQILKKLSTKGSNELEPKTIMPKARENIDLQRQAPPPENQHQERVQQFEQQQEFMKSTGLSAINKVNMSDDLISPTQIQEASSSILFPRIMAYTIDLICSLPISLFLLIPFIGLFFFVPFYMLYWFSRDSFFGNQSIGKRALNLKVVCDDGSKFNWGKSAIRNIVFLIYILLLIPLLIPFIGVVLTPILTTVAGLIETISVLVSKKRIGDHFAKTIVIRTET